MQAKVATWFTILRICLEERLVYRGDFALGTLMRFLPIVTQIFLWSAVFRASGSANIAGYTSSSIVAYYLLTMISRAFSSMPGLASGIASEIRSGEIKKFIIQPIDMITFLMLSRIAHKLVYYLIAIVPFTLVFFLLRGYFSGWPDPEVICAYILSLLMSFVLGFFLEATIGMIGFWYLEVSSLLFVYMLFNFFFSGHMFPLDMLAEKVPWAYYVMQALPLQYLAYFPAAVFLETIHGSALWWGLAIQFGWVVFFAFACRWTLNMGLKRYAGYGG